MVGLKLGITKGLAGSSLPQVSYREGLTLIPHCREGIILPRSLNSYTHSVRGTLGADSFNQRFRRPSAKWQHNSETGTSRRSTSRSLDYFCYFKCQAATLY